MQKSQLMTFLEILILSFNISALLTRKRTLKIFLALANLAPIAIQLLLDLYRWQMLPSYVFAGMHLIVLVLTSPGTGNKRKWILLRVFFVICWTLVSAIPYLFPLFELPDTTGKYSVGTREWILKDTSRFEIYTSLPDDTRKFTAKIWYPGTPTPKGDFKRNPYMPNASTESKAFANLTGLPEFFLTHLRLIKTHSFVGSPLTDRLSVFPVILFSHGHAFYASARQNTSLMEELASHGFVVIALNHPYESLATVFPEMNEMALLDTALIHEIRGSVTRGPTRDSLVAIISKADAITAKMAHEELLKCNGLLARSVDIWQKDVAYVVSHVLENPPDAEFVGRLDTNNIGIVGMSLGGANAAVSCSESPQIKAGINMDGFVYGDAYTEGIAQPFTFMYSQRNIEMNRFLYRRMSGDTYVMNIQGTEHTDFSEFSFFSNIGSPNRISPEKCHAIINNYCLLFFNKYLRNRNAIQLGSLNEKFDEIEIKKIEVSTNEK